MSKLYAWQNDLGVGDYAVLYVDHVTHYAEVVDLDDDVAYLVCVCHAAHAAPVRHEVPRALFAFPLTRDQYRAACASGWPDHPARVNSLLGWTTGSEEEN